MRINDIINEASASLRVPPGDPILNDSNLARLLEHYLGAVFLEWAIDNSPYNTSGRGFVQQAQAAAIKPIYNKIAAAIKPLAAEENPDINKIVRVIDSQLPVGGIPQNIKSRIAQQQAADAKTGWVWREKSTPAAEPTAMPDTVQVAKWTVPDER